LIGITWILSLLTLLKGSPEGSASSLACYTPLTDSNINTAAQLWVSDQAYSASTYGDLNQWDVSTVTDMSSSKSYLYWRMTWRDVNSCYCDGRVQSGLGWWWWCAVKMVERCGVEACGRLRELSVLPSWPIVTTTTYVVRD
jgi:hypothetical protein